MTASKEPLGAAVVHNEVALADAEKTQQIDSLSIQTDREQMEERKIDMRTILAILV